MEEKTCCVTGHRDIPADETAHVKKVLRREIEKAVNDGFTVFLSGFADGVDQYFAEIVLELQSKNPGLKLIAALPYRKRLDSLCQKEHTNALLDACAEVIVIQEEYKPNVYAKRNRYMAEHSDRVIAVYDGREKGGTVKNDSFCSPISERITGNTDRAKLGQKQDKSWTKPEMKKWRYRLLYDIINVQP